MFYISTNFPKKLIVDEQKIKQIVINLLSNAIKFTQNGTITIYLGWKSNTPHETNLTVTYEEEDYLYLKQFE
jgi:signal transduction histidine kinase